MEESTEPKPENKTKALARVETSVCGLVLNNLEDMKTVAQLILQSGLAPDSFKTAEQIFVGLQTGAEIGLKPMQALNSIVVIKGKPTLWGDAALALVKKSGLLLKYTEKVTGEGDDMVAYVKSARYEGEGKDACIVETTFSVADAKEAKLWGKQGPWTTHKKRMLKYKARAFNLRDNFPDVLFGMHMTEEMYGEEPLPAPESDVAPRDERRLTVPSQTVDTTRAPVQEVVEAISEVGAKAATVQEVREKVVETLEKVNDAVLGPEPETVPEEKPETELQTFVCKSCGQTFKYGKEEGHGVQCECGKGVLVEVLTEAEPPAPEPAPAEPAAEEEKKTEDVKELYVDVNAAYIALNGQDFIAFASYVLCIDDMEVSPSKLTEEQLLQIKAYIESNGVAIS